MTYSSIQTSVAGRKDHATPDVAEPDEARDWIDTGDNDPPLDQAYLDHISQGVINERLKKERPKGVSPNVCALLKN